MTPVLPVRREGTRCSPSLGIPSPVEQISTMSPRFLRQRRNLQGWAGLRAPPEVLLCGIAPPDPTLKAGPGLMALPWLLLFCSRYLS